MRTLCFGYEEAPIPCDQTDSSEGTIPFLNTHNEFPPSLIVNEKIAPLEPVILSATSAASDTASNAQEKNVNQDTSGNEDKGTTGGTATEWEYIAPNQLLLQHRIGRSKYYYIHLLTISNESNSIDSHHRKSTKLENLTIFIDLFSRLPLLSISHSLLIKLFVSEFASIFVPELSIAIF